MITSLIILFIVGFLICIFIADSKREIQKEIRNELHNIDMVSEFPIYPSTNMRNRSRAWIRSTNEVLELNGEKWIKIR